MLAHSLRDAGTTKKLAVLVTLDSVSADVITQLKVSFLGRHSHASYASRSLTVAPGRIRLCDPRYPHPQ